MEKRTLAGGKSYVDEAQHFSASEQALCDRCGAWRGSLGLEPTPELYVAHLVEVFREVKRVLRDDGTCWLNLGDSYVSATQVDNHADPKAPRRVPGGRCRTNVLKPKDLCGIPWRVALALQADGWWLRSDIIWAKPNCMPESVTDRPTRQHEYVFLLSKSARYFYDADAVREESADPNRTNFAHGPKMDQSRNDTDRMDFGGGNGRNRRTVWTIPTFPFPSVVSYGSYRIASPDCPVHDYHAGLAHVQQYGEQLIAFPFGHNPDTGAGPAQGQEGVVVSIPVGQFASLSDACAATFRSNQMSKTVVESGQDVIFYGISGDRTEYRELLDHYAATFDRTRGNKTAQDSEAGEPENYPSGQKTFRIVGIETYESPPVDCTCYYTGKPKRSQDHFAVFPPALVEPMVKAGSAEGDTILDPFGGAGTTALVADRLGRDAILIELNEEYAAMAQDRIASEAPMFADVVMG